MGQNLSLGGKRKTVAFLTSLPFPTTNENEKEESQKMVLISNLIYQLKRLTYFLEHMNISVLTVLLKG